MFFDGGTPFRVCLINAKYLFLAGGVATVALCKDRRVIRTAPLLDSSCGGFDVATSLNQLGSKRYEMYSRFVLFGRVSPKALSGNASEPSGAWKPIITRQDKTTSESQAFRANSSFSLALSLSPAFLSFSGHCGSFPVCYTHSWERSGTVDGFKPADLRLGIQLTLQLTAHQFSLLPAPEKNSSVQRERGYS